MDGTRIDTTSQIINLLNGKRLFMKYNSKKPSTYPLIQTPSAEGFVEAPFLPPAKTAIRPNLKLKLTH
jgi:hypothetical protein